MRGMWSDPPLRRSSIYLLIWGLSFCMVVLGMYQLQTRMLKEAYILTAGVAVQKAVALEPSLETELIPVLTAEISAKEREEAKKFLAGYFVNPMLEDAVFPNIGAELQAGRRNLILAFLLFFGLLEGMNFLEHRRRYRRIRELSDKAERVSRGEKSHLDWAMDKGEWGRLGRAFENMTHVVESSMGALAKEKEFLKEILADISHQLKTPMASLILYTELMNKEDLAERDRRLFLARCDEQLQRMQWLIRSLLTFARIDAGSIVFVKEDKSLRSTMQRAIDSLSGWIDRKQLSIRLQVASETLFSHDEQWIAEAFANILKNAVEYSKEGGNIDISIQDYAAFKRVTITDYGEGIAAEELPKIFKRFYRARRSCGSDSGSSVGIGLSLAQAIVKAHGGYIEATSQPGEKTKFSIVFVD